MTPTQRLGRGVALTVYGACLVWGTAYTASAGWRTGGVGWWAFTVLGALALWALARAVSTRTP